MRMSPIMVPYRTSGGVRYQVLEIQLKLVGGVEGESLSETASVRQQSGCFMVPIIAEKMLIYLYKANLQPEDFVGQRREVLAKKLMDVAVQTTDTDTYGGLVLVDDATPPLDPKSTTMSKQCR